MSHIRLIITLLIVMLWSNSALAEAKKFNPLVTYTCDSTADIIVITNSLLTPEEAKTYKFSDADGTYNPWKMAKLHLNAKVSALLKTNRTVNKCTLSSGEYTSTIEPKIFSRDTPVLNADSLFRHPLLSILMAMRCLKKRPLKITVTEMRLSSPVLLFSVRPRKSK